MDSDPYKLVGFVNQLVLFQYPIEKKTKISNPFGPRKNGTQGKDYSFKLLKSCFNKRTKHWKRTRKWQTRLGCRNGIWVGIHYLRQANERTTLRIWILDLLCVCVCALLLFSLQCRERRDRSGSLAELNLRAKCSYQWWVGLTRARWHTVIVRVEIP